uniref:natural cytotoxicity triggering receptor 3 ligand 1 n=1 Tax=Callithrix jacchus TaxID=9483 RepID=UPI0023DD1AD5
LFPYDLINSQRPCLQIPSHGCGGGRSGLNINFGGPKHSVNSTSQKHIHKLENGTLCSLTATGELKVEMMAGGTQIIPLNDNVTIFCNFFDSEPHNITSVGITWFRKSPTFDKEFKVFEFFGDHLKAFRPGATVSPWRLKSGDASLQLPGVQLEEAGEYRCEVVSTPKKAHGRVWLGVVASPACRLFLDQVVVKENEGKYIMCESSGFYPEAINITWEKWTQEVPHHVEIFEDVIPGPTIKNVDGTFSVTSKLKLKSSQEDPETVYQCVVQHMSLYTPWRSNFTLTSQQRFSESEKTATFAIYWWILPLIGVGLILLIVLIYCKKVTPEGQRRLQDAFSLLFF